LTTDANPGADVSITLVLLCQGLDKTALALELAELGSWLLSHLQGVKVGTAEDLCHQPGAVRTAIRQTSAHRLVLGLCSREHPEVELQAHARRAGLDPLGTQMVDLGSLSGWDAPHRAHLILAAAVSRARAFPGALPENTRAVLLSSGQEISRRSLFTLPPVSYVTVPTINRSLCTAKDGCDQCVRACPHSALEKDGDVVLVNRSRCQSCGICVAGCPQRAVEFPGWSAQELEAQVSSLLETEADLESRAVAFVCKNAPTSTGGDWLPVHVPCASMVSADAILETLAWGASAVALQSCSDKCPTGLAETVQGRVDYCQQLLRRLGGPCAERRVQALNADGAVPPEPAPPPLPGDTPAGPEEGTGYGVQGTGYGVREDSFPLPPEPRTLYPHDRPIRLFGRGVAAKAVLELAARYGARELVMDHPWSPLSQVEIEERACTGCGTCAVACPWEALSYDSGQDGVALRFDASLCAGCGQCQSVCPERASGAIRVSPVTSLHNISRGPQTVFKDREVLCERCGAPIATRRMLARIAAILGDGYTPQAMGRLCANCRGV
jgi:ferredoxin